jgi:hypothetical protein
MSPTKIARFVARHLYWLPILLAGYAFQATTGLWAWGNLVGSVLLVVGRVLVDYAYEYKAVDS